MVFQGESLECGIDHFRLGVVMDLQDLVEGGSAGILGTNAATGKHLGAELGLTRAGGKFILGHEAGKDVGDSVLRDAPFAMACHAFHDVLGANRDGWDEVEGHFATCFVDGEDGRRPARWAIVDEEAALVDVVAGTDEGKDHVGGDLGRRADTSLNVPRCGEGGCRAQECWDVCGRDVLYVSLSLALLGMT